MICQNFLGVSWPFPHPVLGKIICAPARLTQDKAMYKTWSP